MCFVFLFVKLSNIFLRSKNILAEIYPSSCHNSSKITKFPQVFTIFTKNFIRLPKHFLYNFIKIARNMIVMTFQNTYNMLKRCCKVGPWKAYKVRLSSPLLTPLFHENLHSVFNVIHLYYLKPGLHLNVNANDTCGSETRQNTWYICTLLAFAEASNTPSINAFNRILFEVPTVYG